MKDPRAVWSDIKTRRLAGGRVQLLAPVVYYIDSRLRIEVPAGFICDLASVPRWLPRWLPDKLRSAPGAILHDYLYAAGTTSREQADHLARIVWDADPDMNGWGALYWAGVRVGGRSAWQRHRSRSA